MLSEEGLLGLIYRWSILIFFRVGVVVFTSFAVVFAFSGIIFNDFLIGYISMAFEDCLGVLTEECLLEVLLDLAVDSIAL
jgi:hypothetical protein